MGDAGGDAVGDAVGLGEAVGEAEAESVPVGVAVGMSPVFWRRRTLRRAASSAPAAPGTGSATAARLWKSLSERLCSEKTALSSAASRGWCFRSRGCRSGSPETRARQRATRARKLSRRAILQETSGIHRRIFKRDRRDRRDRREIEKDRQGDGGFM